MIDTRLPIGHGVVVTGNFRHGKEGEYIGPSTDPDFPLRVNFGFVNEVFAGSELEGVPHAG